MDPVVPGPIVDAELYAPGDPAIARGRVHRCV